MLMLKTAGEVRQLVYTSDCSRLAAWAQAIDAPPVVSWWDLQTGEELAPTHLSGWPSHVAIASHADRIAYQTGTGVYFLKRNDEYVGRGDSGPARRDTMAITPDAGLLAVSGALRSQPLQRSVVEVFRPNQSLTPDRRFSSSLHVKLLALSNDGRFLASAGEGGLSIWDLNAGESIATVRSNLVDCVRFAPHGFSFAAVRGAELSLHETMTGKIRWLLRGHENSDFTGVDFSPDGRIVLIASKSGLVEWCDSTDGRPIAKFDWQIGPMMSVAFSHDGLTCAAGNCDGQIVVWDVEE